MTTDRVFLPLGPKTPRRGRASVDSLSQRQCGLLRPLDEAGLGPMHPGERDRAVPLGPRRLGRPGRRFFNVEGVDEVSYGDPAGLYREVCKLPRYAVTTGTKS